MLRDEIGDVLLNFRLLGLTIKEGEDAILALIAGQRCEWEKDGDGDWDTECGCCYDGEHWFEPVNVFCPGCGRKIEVKGS